MEMMIELVALYLQLFITYVIITANKIVYNSVYTKCVVVHFFDSLSLSKELNTEHEYKILHKIKYKYINMMNKNS